MTFAISRGSSRLADAVGRSPIPRSRGLLAGIGQGGLTIQPALLPCSEFAARTQGRRRRGKSMSYAVVPEVRPPADAAPGRPLAVVAASTVLTLAAFVTPLATGVRTAADLGTGPAGQAWLLSAMSVGLAAALLVAGVAADDLGHRRGVAPRPGLLGGRAGAAPAPRGHRGL